ncbi:MAG: hypothetical protein JXA10_05575 [Anaerolineae bacterium]|nr:hypothetical protein [Anaerolineae bacterium]
MADDIIDKRIDEGTLEAFESICGVLGHNITGQFSIFDGAWQVINLAASDNGPANTLSPAEQTQLREAVTAIMRRVEAVMQINKDIRTFLFPPIWDDPNASPQAKRAYNQARWSPYDRPAWNTFFAGVRVHLDRALAQLDQIEKCVADLHTLKITYALPSFNHFEPMLAANLRERLCQIIDTYTV